MSRALRFSKADLRNAVRLVKDEGVAVKLARDGSILVFPATNTPALVDRTEDGDLDAELAAFEAQHGDG